MIKLWKNWTVHNIICHPAAQIAYWLIRPFSIDRADSIYSLIHNSSLPESDDSELQKFEVKDMWG